MRTKALILWTTLLLLLFAIEACFSSERLDQGQADSGPVFDHQGHLARGVECGDCHGGEDQEWKAKPGFDTCQECHEEIDAKVPVDKRASIFFDAEKKPSWSQRGAQSAEVIFTHGAHVKSGVKCEDCHPAIASSTSVPRSTRVVMDRCTSCHESQAPKANDCQDCHNELRKDVAPKSHRGGWMRAHGLVAREGGFDPFPADCQICHERSTCDSCHAAELPRSHNHLFRQRSHGVLASMDRESCQVCHSEDSCTQCHKENPPRSHRGSWSAPFNRHCQGCHLPLEVGREDGCGVCHNGTPSHWSAPLIPANPAHAGASLESCRSCHSPMPHPDNGQSCFHCHN